MPVLPDSVSFHVLTTRSCRVEVGGPTGEVVELRAGDLALVPHGAGHLLRSDPGAAPAARARRCCAARELLALLPPVVHVGARDASGPTAIQDTLRLMSAGLAAVRPGGEAIATRLADVLVVQAVRAWLDRDPAARTGWLGALDDPRLVRVLAAVHAAPGRDWTLDALAAEAAMPRTAFAARFAEVVGEPPMRYVTRWRMNLAHDRLRTGGATVAAVAGDLG